MFLWPMLWIAYIHLIKQLTLSCNPDFLSKADNFYVPILQHIVRGNNKNIIAS